MNTKFARATVSIFFVFFTAAACGPADPTSDAGPDEDAGALQDGGPTDDAGTDDGGPDDAGPADPCDAVTLDPVLGSLTTSAGFTVIDSAELSGTIVAVAAVEVGAALTIYGLDSSTDVLTLGTWPTLSGTDVLFSILPTGVSSDAVFPSPFLAVDGTARLAAGYSEPFNATTGTAPGSIAVYDLSGANAVTHVVAESNFTASFFGGRLVVNGAGLADASGGNALYFWDESATPSSGVLAEFDSSWMASSGFTASTASTLAAGGFYDDGGGAGNQLLRITSAQVDAVVAGGAAIDLGAAESVASGALSAAAGFGDGLAVIRGDYFSPLEGVQLIDLADAADRTPRFVLEADADECTNIDLLASAGDDLLVGVEDANGRRLLRVSNDG